MLWLENAPLAADTLGHLSNNPSQLMLVVCKMDFL
jgi:hypothetical protein